MNGVLCVWCVSRSMTGHNRYGVVVSDVWWDVDQCCTYRW